MMGAGRSTLSRRSAANTIGEPPPLAEPRAVLLRPQAAAATVAIETVELDKQQASPLTRELLLYLAQGGSRATRCSRPPVALRPRTQEQAQRVPRRPSLRSDPQP